MKEAHVVSIFRGKLFHGSILQYSWAVEYPTKISELERRRSLCVHSFNERFVTNIFGASFYRNGGIVGFRGQIVLELYIFSS